MHARRGGFTLIELLVVVSILGLLVALILPAVQSARESARRLQCIDHLKQVGIAMAQHQSQLSAYPSARQARWRHAPGSDRLVAYPYPRQGFYDLLPFFEEVPLYNAFNTAIDLAALLPAELSANSTARATAIAALLCPSDGGATRVMHGPGSYRFNVGMLGTPASTGGTDYLFRPGAFVLISGSRPQDFTDGLSQTVGVCERLLGSRAGSSISPDRRRDLWYLGMARLVTPTSADEVLGYCAGLQGVPLEFQADLGRSWDESSFTSGWYSHVAPPNAAVMDCTLGQREGTGLSDTDLNDTAVTARSAHPGGVNALMMDGSVRSIRNGINPSIWRSLGTRSGGEVLDSSY